jgi:hypothetical protein
MIQSPPAFDGFVEQSKRVPSTCLISFKRNRYSIPASFANRPVSLRVYPDRLVVAAGGNMGRGYPFYAFSASIRKICYTTNAVGSTRMQRKTLKATGSLPTEEAATKLPFLAILNFEKGGRAVRERVAARNQLAILLAGRFDALAYLKTA